MSFSQLRNCVHVCPDVLLMAHGAPCSGHCPGRLAEASVDVTDTVKGGRYGRMAVPLDDTRSTRRASSDIMLFIGVRVVPIGSAATIIAHLPTRSLPNADDRSREVTRALTPRGGRRKTRDRSASRHSVSSLESHVSLVSVGSLDPSGGSSSSLSGHKSDDDDTLSSSVQSEPGAGSGPGAGQGMPVHVVGDCAPGSRDPHVAAPESPPTSCVDSDASGGVELAYGFAAQTLGASPLSVDVRGGAGGSGAMAVVVSPKHPDDVIRKLFSYYSNAGSGTVTLKDLVVGLHKKCVMRARPCTTFLMTVSVRHSDTWQSFSTTQQHASGGVRKGQCTWHCVPRDTCVRPVVRLVHHRLTPRAAMLQYFRCAGLTAHDAMTLDHFRRWCRGSPVCDDVYMPVPLVPIHQGSAAVTPSMRVIREEPDADDPMALAPMLLHFVPGHTLEKRISAAFASMDVRQAGVVSRSELEAGVARLYVRTLHAVRGMVVHAA